MKLQSDPGERDVERKGIQEEAIAEGGSSYSTRGNDSPHYRPICVI